MQKLSMKQAIEKALCKMCARRFACDFNEYEHTEVKIGGCALRGVMIRDILDDLWF